MNILSYSHAYMGGGHNGGAETTLHDLMRLLRLNKHTTTALLSKPHEDGSGSFVLDGVKVQAHASKKDPEFYIPDNDLVISHLECAARAGLIARKNGKKSIQLLHNDQAYCVESAEKYSDALIFNTEWIQSAYKNCNVPGVLLHPPVDPKRYKVDTSREYITLINLTVGNTHRLSYDKGAHTFYELARRFPDYKFLGVKGGYGDQYVPDDLPNNVTIVEHSNNILDVYRRTRLLLVPSKYESYGRVAVEGACSGIPTLSFETLGTREAMGDDAGFCQSHEDDEWAVKLEDMLYQYGLFAWAALDRAQRNWERTREQFQNVQDMIANL